MNPEEKQEKTVRMGGAGSSGKRKQKAVKGEPSSPAWLAESTKHSAGLAPAPFG